MFSNFWIFTGKKVKEEEHEESEDEAELLDDKSVLEGEDANLSAEELQRKIDKIIKVCVHGWSQRCTVFKPFRSEWCK